MLLHRYSTVKPKKEVQYKEPGLPNAVWGEGFDFQVNHALLPPLHALYGIFQWVDAVICRYAA